MCKKHKHKLKCWLINPIENTPEFGKQNCNQKPQKIQEVLQVGADSLLLPEMSRPGRLLTAMDKVPVISLSLSFQRNQMLKKGKNIEVISLKTFFELSFLYCALDSLSFNTVI